MFVIVSSLELSQICYKEQIIDEFFMIVKLFT